MSKTRLSVTVDPELVDEAMRVTGADTKREAIETALTELVRSRRLEAMMDRAGKVELCVSRKELLADREEE